jgi:uncharacterized membrane protein YedE/YeeE
MEPAALTGVLVGLAYGYVAQRGAFCMNSGFRFAVTRRDFTKIKAYGLAVAVQMLVVPALVALGALSAPSYPGFFPLGAVLGGLLFGVSMSWAGGCAAGVCYKIGGGSFASVVSIAGMAVGATIAQIGPLAPLRELTQSVGARAVSLQPSGIGWPLWAMAVPLALVILLVLWRSAPGKAGAWSWRRTGLLMGAVGVAAWLLSDLAHRSFGLAVIPGAVGAFQLVTGGDVARLAWDVLLVLAIPAGAYLAARRDGPVRFSLPTDPRAAARNFAGGLGLGIGAALAGGCTLGHGLAGIPILAPGSFVAMGAIFAGSALAALWQARRTRLAAALAAPAVRETP